MELLIHFRDSGFFLELSGASRRSFPLDATMQSGKFSDWERLNAAEQLWYDGLLTYLPNDNGYLLTPESYFLLDAESKITLGFPPENANIRVSERGNIGSKNYQIFWDILIGNRPGGKFTRNGVVISCGEKNYTLSYAQWQLVDWIDTHVASSTIQDRGQYHAKTLFLAKRAGAVVDDFMLSREFLFANEADYEISAPSAQEISFVPTLPEIPKEVQEILPSQLSSSVRTSTNGKRRTLFVSPEARTTYNRVAALPDLYGSQVPKFLDNPSEFLPDTIEFDAEEFSKRVKGLKIRTSTAVPFVKLAESIDKPGWFDVESGISLRSNDEEEPTPASTPELLILMEQAAEANEDYVFYNDQWVKIPPNLLETYRKAEAELEQSCGHRIHENQRQLILDIYDNLNGIEYNEALLEFKTRDPNDMRTLTVPECFCGKLYDYQQDGYGFIRAHFETNTGVLLADDMGLGKTVQLIAFLSHLFSVDSLATALLVMPKSLIDNWEKEIRKFLPDARRIYVHQGAQRLKTIEYISSFDIVLTTYETLSRDQTLLGRIKWSCVICDEAQKIKNFKTVAANAVKGMNTKCRIAVTGTPVENRLSELWSIADFAQPGLLGSYQNFWKNYEKPISSGNDSNCNLTNSLIDKLSPIFLRRTKDEALSGKLPLKTEIPITLSMDSATRKLYVQMIRDVQDMEEQGMMLALIQKLIMLCSHPRLVTGVGGYYNESVDQLVRESPKLLWTVNKLQEIFAAGEKVILFTKYVRMQHMLRYVLAQKFGINAEIINGEVTGNRLSIVDRLQSQSGAGAIILSPKAAGVGLTITSANHVIHYTREWNPAVENQATDRAYRIGQERPVYVYYPILVCDDFLSADERLDQLLNSKRELMQRVIIPADLSVKIDDFGNIFDQIIRK